MRLLLLSLEILFIYKNAVYCIIYKTVVCIPRDRQNGAKSKKIKSEWSWKRVTALVETEKKKETSDDSTAGKKLIYE